MSIAWRLAIGTTESYDYQSIPMLLSSLLFSEHDMPNSRQIHHLEALWVCLPVDLRAK